jgi:hypothetical protein
LRGWRARFSASLESNDEISLPSKPGIVPQHLLNPSMTSDLSELPKLDEQTFYTFLPDRDNAPHDNPRHDWVLFKHDDGEWQALGKEEDL